MFFTTILPAASRWCSQSGTRNAVRAENGVKDAGHPHLYVRRNRWGCGELTHEHHVVVHAVHTGRFQVAAAFPVGTFGPAGVVVVKVAEELRVRDDVTI